MKSPIDPTAAGHTSPPKPKAGQGDSAAEHEAWVDTILVDATEHQQPSPRDAGDGWVDTVPLGL